MKACLLLAAIVNIAVAAPPDWTGFYMLATGHDLDGLNVVSPNLGKTVVDHLQPWAKLKMESSDGDADDTGAVCMQPGILRAPAAPFSSAFSVFPSPDKIVLPYWELSGSRVRRIYLNRPHPKDLLPTWNGDSIGHWEGDTLVVDTIGFNDKSWLSGNMAPHTEETRLIERMRQIQHNGNTYIEVAAVVEDRKALTSAYTYTRYYKKSDIEMDIHVCAEDLTLWKHWRNEALKKANARAAEVK